MSVPAPTQAEPQGATADVWGFGAQPPLTPLVFACPHAGRIYPQSVVEASALGPAELRLCEDAHVDALLAHAFARGFAGVVCRLARVYVDVNRDPRELDPLLLSPAPPRGSYIYSARVAAGLGVTPRVVSEGREIYREKLNPAEVEARLARVHAPYHAAIGARLAAAKARFGVGVLVDWHSMPSSVARGGGRTGRGRPEVVLGDRNGGACGGALTRTAASAFERLGYAVALNAPYAGGYTTQKWGRPGEGLHALQIELDRGLYLDEASMEPTAGITRLKRDVNTVIAELAAVDWPKALGG